jgi:peptidoglycan/LPS O-acetylase OafA/YrhL
LALETLKTPRIPPQPLTASLAAAPMMRGPFREAKLPKPNDRSDQSRVPGLDLLRLVAVAAVVFYHYGFWGPASNGVPQVALPYFASYAQYGFLGVPIFFTISGFVIAYSAEGRTPVGFAIARFSRIYPTFLFCMTLTFATILLLGGTTFEVNFAQWFANLFVAAPALGQSYVDTSYWSLVIEIVFYAWVAAFLALGLFPRRIDAIILVWLGITFANELTIDAPIFEKIFIADDSGFFAVGLLIYEYYRGRRDLKLYSILALSVGTSVSQAIHKLERLGVHTGGSFDVRIVAAICLLSIAVIFLATRIRRLPLPAGLILAVGGITYPLYLLHMQMGYTILAGVAPVRNAELWTAAIVSGAVILAWATWRFVEGPAHRWTKDSMTAFAAKLGWRLHPRAAVASESTPASTRS